MPHAGSVRDEWFFMGRWTGIERRGVCRAVGALKSAKGGTPHPPVFCVRVANAGLMGNGMKEVVWA